MKSASVLFRWRHPQASSLTHYTVQYRHTDEKEAWLQWEENHVTATEYEMSDLLQERHYQFRVYAWNNKIRSASSNIWLVTDRGEGT